MLIVFFEVLYLLHDFTEYLGTILRWITVFDQTYLDIELEATPHKTKGLEKS